MGRFRPGGTRGRRDCQSREVEAGRHTGYNNSIFPPRFAQRLATLNKLDTLTGHLKFAIWLAVSAPPCLSLPQPRDVNEQQYKGDEFNQLVRRGAVINIIHGANVDGRCKIADSQRDIFSHDMQVTMRRFGEVCPTRTIEHLSVP